MDLAKYKELTGATVSEAEEARFNASIRKVNSKLESALGYSLSPTKNLDKEELGKVQFQGAYPAYPVDVNNLVAADEADGSFRVFTYNDKDIYVATDPFRNVYHVKLVQARNDDSFVTVMDLPDFSIRTGRKFGKFVQKGTAWFNWDWYSWLVDEIGNGNGLMVAVDADWLTCENLPSDLSDLWVDMVAYYSDENYSVTGSIKTESVNGHSWSRANAGGGKSQDLAPEQSDAGLAVLKYYAGPDGNAASRIPTV